MAKPGSKFQSEERQEKSRSVWSAVASAPLFSGDGTVVVNVAASDEAKAAINRTQSRRFARFESCLDIRGASGLRPALAELFPGSAKDFLDLRMSQVGRKRR